MALKHKWAQCTKPHTLYKSGPEGEMGTSSTAPEVPYWYRKSQSVLPPKAQPLQAFLTFHLIELSQIYEVGRDHEYDVTEEKIDTEM